MALEISLLDNRGREMDEVCMFHSFTIGSGEMWKRPMRPFFFFFKQASVSEFFFKPQRIIEKSNKSKMTL